MNKSFGFLASILVVVGALVSSAACTTTTNVAANGACANIAGTWATSGTCGASTCIVTQNGCTTGFQCSGAVSYSGSVNGDDASYSGLDAAGDQGSCNVTISGASFAGTCTVQGTTCTVQGTESSATTTTPPGNGGAGSPGTAVNDTCTATHPCSCPAGATCDFLCTGTDDCTATCAAGSTCDLACSSGSCSLTCNGATCNQTCSSGQCDGTAIAAVSLHQTCSSGSCDLDCDSATESCVQISSVGSHTCEGCK